MDKILKQIVSFCMIILAVIIIIIGVLGLILPVIPGILLIVLGLILLSKYTNIRFVNDAKRYIKIKLKERKNRKMYYKKKRKGF